MIEILALDPPSPPAVPTPSPEVYKGITILKLRTSEQAWPQPATWGCAVGQSWRELSETGGLGKESLTAGGHS